MSGRWTLMEEVGMHASVERNPQKQKRRRAGFSGEPAGVGGVSDVTLWAWSG